MKMNNDDSGLGPMHLRENSLAELTVQRISDMGAFLDAGTGATSDDILLHHSQQTRPVEVGEKVKVFLYHDPHHRLTASMRLPQIPVGGIGYAPVMLTTRFGAFIDVGTERGIFLPFSQMEERVETGQSIWVKMYVDKTGRLAVTMKVNEDIRKIALPAEGVKVGDMVTGTVYNKTGDGIFLITRKRWIAFLHRDEIVKPIHMGDEITGRVTFLRKDGHLNISLRPQKEKSMEGDMQLLLDYMNRHNGSLPFTDQSDPALIKASLGISKSAFKRAVGHLLKLKKISMKEGKITLV
nr:S1-like domain-containing RNA-binding protein [uncultured Dialister sp.]